MRTLVLFVLGLCTISCAKPTYVSPGQDLNQQKVTGCAAHFKSGDCVTWNWETKSTPTTFGTFIVKTGRLNKADQSFLAQDLEGHLAVVLWMPGMGHGSSPVTVEKLDIGTYRASRVFFTMAGDWEIRVQLKDGDEIKDEAVIPLIF
ncbi:MAG: FixH family protein [Bdellovibrionales bacterium]|nr:FixH family protein [Bdellovibrionales bacterium]